MHDGLVKDRLLDSALMLFAEEGFDAISVDKVRTAAGVSNGSFFHLFETKADLAAELLVACVRDYQEHVADSLSDTPNAPEGVGAIVRSHLRWVHRNRSKARFMLEEARSAWFTQAAGRLKTHNAAFVGAIDRWRSPLLARGQLRPMPIEVFMAMLIGPANLLCRMWLTGLKPSTTSPLRFEQELVEAARRALITSWKGASQ